MFHLGTLLLFIYICARLVVPTRLPMAAKVGLAVITLAVSEVHLIYRWAFGTMFSPELPRVVVIAIGWAFGMLVLAAALQLLVDVARILLRATRIPLPVRRIPLLRWVVLLVAAMLSAVGIWSAVAPPRIHTVTLEAGLPPAWRGLRVVQLSDLHLSTLFDRDWAENVVRQVNAQSPDLIVITGDSVDGTPARRLSAVQALTGLHATYGVIMVPGNHEYYFDGPRWVQTYRHLGLPTLVNQHLVFRRHEQSLVIAGLTDATAREYGLEGPDLAKALIGAPAGTPVIVLSHRPTGAAINARLGAAIQLSGHTHGGMMPGLSAVTAAANEGFVSGLYRVGHMLLYVSNGTGIWNGFPLRLSAPPEVMVFTLN